MTKPQSQWKPWHKIVLSVCAAIMVAAILIAVFAPDPEPEPTAKATPARVEQPATPVASATRPSGQVLAAVRASLKGKATIDADRAAEVVDGDTHYVAVRLAGSTAVVLVSYKDDAEYLSGLTAVNGAARSNTDLPAGPATVPDAAGRALAAVE